MKKLVAVLILSLLAAVSAPALTHAAEVVGKVIAVKGSVLVLHEGSESSTLMKKGDKVYVRDMVDTGNGKAKLLMNDESVLTLGKNTNLVVREYSINKTTNKRSSVLGLLRGKLRTLVQRMFSGSGSKFEVHTPTAVAGVRSTHTGYEVTDAGTEVRTFEGITFVRVGDDTQVFEAGKMIQVLTGMDAMNVFTMSDADLQEFIADTVMGDDVDESDPAGDAAGQDQNDYDENDVMELNSADSGDDGDAYDGYANVGDDDEGDADEGDAEGEDGDDQGKHHGNFNTYDNVPHGGTGGGGTDSSPSNPMYY